MVSSRPSRTRTLGQGRTHPILLVSPARERPDAFIVVGSVCSLGLAAEWKTLPQCFLAMAGNRKEARP